METPKKVMKRREFLTTAGTTMAGVMLINPMSSLMAQAGSVKKMRLAMI